MIKIDPFGGYPYEPGYCTRDAFRQYYGKLHDAWFPEGCTWARVVEFARAYGLEHCIGEGFDRSFPIGLAVIWGYEQPGLSYGHASFCRDPRPLVEVQDAGLIRLGGYVIPE